MKKKIFIFIFIFFLGVLFFLFNKNYYLEITILPSKTNEIERDEKSRIIKPIPQDHRDIASNFIFSNNDKRFAYMIEKDEKEKVIIDSKEGKWYDSVDHASFVFSPNSEHFAYIAKNENKYFVVLNGIEKEKYEKVSNLKYSADSNYLIYDAIEGKNILTIKEKI